MLVHPLGDIGVPALLQPAHLAAQDGQGGLEAVRQSSGPIAGLANELFLPIEQRVDASDQRRDLVGEMGGHPVHASGLDGVEVLSDGPQRSQAQPQLQPREEDENGRDRRQHKRDVPSEGLSQFQDKLVVERHRQAEGPVAALAVQRHVALDDIEFRSVGAIGLEGRLGTGALTGPAGRQLLVPQRARAQHAAPAFRDLPVGAAIGLLVARIGEPLGKFGSPASSRRNAVANSVQWRFRFCST